MKDGDHFASKKLSILVEANQPIRARLAQTLTTQAVLYKLVCSFEFLINLILKFSAQSSIFAQQLKMSSTAVAAPTRTKVAGGKKEKKAKATTANKAAPPSHPTYFQMIKEALLALHERSGSSPHAIAKYMEEKHKSVLPANFKKILGLQLKNNAAKGKLLKIKASFKLSEAGKKESPETKKAAPKAVAAAPKVKAVKKAEGTKKKPEGAKKKAVGVKIVDAGKKVVKAAKKVGAQKTKKAAPLKPKRKQPKSIKSPAAKKARKA